MAWTRPLAPLLLLVKVAATHDSDISDVVRKLDDSRRRRMTDNARRLAAAGHLPASRSVAEVADLFCTFCQALKINARKENLSTLGRPIKVVDGGQPVKELF